MRALGAVHSAYPVIAGRFKDYISTPKSNGYQSLHTGVTLRQPRNQKIEVQIRTAEMNDVAENGVASHWVYKAPDEQGRRQRGAALPLGAGPAGNPRRLRPRRMSSWKTPSWNSTPTRCSASRRRAN